MESAIKIKDKIYYWKWTISYYGLSIFLYIYNGVATLIYIITLKIFNKKLISGPTFLVFLY